MRAHFTTTALVSTLILTFGTCWSSAEISNSAPGQAPASGVQQKVSPGEVPEGLDADDWSIIQQAYLKASNTDIDDQFGVKLAISGDTIVVGALYEDSSTTGVGGDPIDNGAGQAGAAYVFVRSGNSWSQQAYLKPSNTDEWDCFGESVAISGDTIVVGAPNEKSSATGVNGNQTDNSAADAGAAYVFVRSGTTWSQQAYLKASNTETTSMEFFGASVAISGDTILVGAFWEDSAATGINGNQHDNSAPSAGAVYVFVRSGTTWSQQAYLKPSNTDAGDRFGQSVAIWGDTIVVGAVYEDSSATGVNGNEHNNSAEFAGAAYVFVRSGTTWSQQAYLKASNTDERDALGESVAISGDTIVVGAENEDSSAVGVDGNQADNSAEDSGAAYVFVRSGTTWSQQAYLKPSNTDAGDRFGHSVAISGDTILVGALWEDGAATGVDGNQENKTAYYSGAAYVFAGRTSSATGCVILSFESDGSLTWSNAYPDAMTSIERLTDVPAGGSAVKVSETLGVSDGSTAVYNYTVEHPPVVNPSVTMSDGTYSWNDETLSSSPADFLGTVSSYELGQVSAVYLSGPAPSGTIIEVEYSHLPSTTTQVWQSVHTEQSTSEVAQTTVDMSEDIGLFRVRNDPF